MVSEDLQNDTCFEQMDLFVADMWSDLLFAMALIQRHYPSITPWGRFLIQDGEGYTD